MIRRGGWVVLFGLLGCAPTSVAPSLIRYEPIDTTVGENRLGLRTGPRLAQSFQKLDAMTLDQDLGTPVPPEMGVAVEYVRLQPISGNFAAHFGVQAELMYAIPFPGLSALAGISHRWQFGIFSVAPALSVRGGTDFGVGVATAVGSFAGGDLAVTFSASEGETARMGVTPFVAFWQSITPSGPGRTVFFPGAMVFIRFASVELMAGFGRVFSGNAAWNVPLIGVRTGGN